MKPWTNNYLRTFAFAVVMLLYLWFPWNMIRQQERILERGVAYDLPLQPVDPYDVFRGRYISLNYGQWEVPYEETPVSGAVVYLTLDTDSLGMAHPARLFQQPPDAPYLETTVYYTDNERRVATVGTPESLQYFYLNEKIAPLAEQFFTDLTRMQSLEGAPAYARVRLLDGQARIEQVFFEDVPVGEYVRRRMEAGE